MDKQIDRQTDNVKFDDDVAHMESNPKHSILIKTSKALKQELIKS